MAGKIRSRYSKYLTKLAHARAEEIGALNDMGVHSGVDFSEEIAAINKKYQGMIDMAEGHKKRYKYMSKLTDEEIVAQRLSERDMKDLDESLPEKIFTPKEKKIRKRQMTEGEYYDFVCDSTPSQKEKIMMNFKQSGEKLYRSQPEIKIDFEALTGEERERVEDAINYITSQVGNEYFLNTLDIDDLLSLKENLEDYIEGDSSKRIELMMPFLQNIPSWSWNELSTTEIRAIEYARRRDKDSIYGNFKPIQRDREDNLASIILKISPMPVRTQKFRETYHDDARVYNLKSEEGLPSKVFYVEHFLLNNVVPKTLEKLA